ncbi:MAG: hypothetical protein PHD67_05795 [Oscillospiraceae bacterium]|nr:hypothetical protein [Oscillospiraceae bacterium]
MEEETRFFALWDPSSEISSLDNKIILANIGKNSKFFRGFVPAGMDEGQFYALQRGRQGENRF